MLGRAQARNLSAQLRAPSDGKLGRTAGRVRVAEARTDGHRRTVLNVLPVKTLKRAVFRSIAEPHTKPPSTPAPLAMRNRPSQMRNHPSQLVNTSTQLTRRHPDFSAVPRRKPPISRSGTWFARFRERPLLSEHSRLFGSRRSRLARDPTQIAIIEAMTAEETDSDIFLQNLI